MTLWYGFKTWARSVADEARRDLGLDQLDRLDPRSLSASLEIPVFDLSDFRLDTPEVRHLINVEPEVFSAVTVFDGSRRAIVHNDTHAPARQNSNIAHELGHGLLGHPPTPAMDDTGCRVWNKDIEDEAKWIAGCLLVTEEAAMAVARGRLTAEAAAFRLGVSGQMINYRLNATGALKRAARERPRRPAA